MGSGEKEGIVTTSELAKILGYTTARIRQLEKENAFVKVDRGQYDLTKSIHAYVDYQVKKKVEDVDEDMNKTKEETLWTRARRKKSELEYKIMSGELHRSEDVEEVMNQMLASFRAQLLAFPTKAAAKVTGETEIMAIKELLRVEIYEVMEELSNYDPNVFYEISKDNIHLEAELVDTDAKN